jgi:hypothetical protein
MPYADPERGKEWARQHRAKNRDQERERQRVWRAANRDRRNAWEREYRKQEYVRSMRSDGKAKFRMLFKEAYVESVSRSKVWKRDAGLCGICGEAANPQSWHLDHITPLSRGGLHCYANVQVSHPMCNMKKGAKIL